METKRNKAGRALLVATAFGALLLQTLNSSALTLSDDLHPESKSFVFGSQAPILLGGLPIASTTHEGSEPINIAEIAAYDHLLGNDGQLLPPGADDIDMIETGSIVAGVFDSIAIPIRSFPVAKRWGRIMDRISACSASGSCSGKNKLLEKIAKQVEGKSLGEKVGLVNTMVNNSIRYQSDQALYDEIDHWATPDETLARASGDCEDFAVLKMTALMRAGLPSKSLSLVVLRDNRRGVFHAILAVTTSSGTFILDNARVKVAMDTDLPNYQPLYSLSGNRAWIHGSRSTSRQQVAGTDEISAVAPGEGFSTDEAPAGTDLASALRAGLPANRAF